MAQCSKEDDSRLLATLRLLLYDDSMPDAETVAQIICALRLAGALPSEAVSGAVSESLQAAGCPKAPARPSPPLTPAASPP